jgi:hypothetical protein
LKSVSPFGIAKVRHWSAFADNRPMRSEKLGPQGGSLYPIRFKTGEHSTRVDSGGICSVRPQNDDVFLFSYP